MTIRKVLYYPDPHLRMVADPVEKVDDKIRRLVDDMFETMYEFHGGGLAATQIDVHKRIITLAPSSNKSETYVLINPEIIESKGTYKYEEGCLSLPGISAEVERARYVKVRALDIKGKSFEIEAEGSYLSVALQHEIDHLSGKLEIDHISQLKRDRLIKKMKKFVALM